VVSPSCRTVLELGHNSDPGRFGKSALQLAASVAEAGRIDPMFGSIFEQLGESLV
jgi:hypothetical protein